jgi:hypothetical protein
MLQELLNKARNWRMKRKTLVIVADIKTGKILVSYKGKSASGGFEDNTLRNMVKGVRFEKSTTNFLVAISQLIKQVCQEQRK